MKKLLLLLFVLSAHPLFACIPRVEVTPPRPVVNDEIEIAMAGTCGCSDIPHNPRVSVTPGLIAVDLEKYGGGCLTVITPWGERVRAQGVPPGEYAVVIRAEGEELARTSVTVRSDPLKLAPSFGTAGTEVFIRNDEIYCEVYPCQPVVTFGGVPATAVRLQTDGRLIATAPAHAPGLVDVVVTLPGGRSISAPQAFLYPDALADLTREHERVLFPVTLQGPGALGSQWTSENVVRNYAPVGVNAITTTLPASGTAQLPVSTAEGGMFVYVPRGLEQFVSYASHIVDRSRRSINAGTEIRVVSERDIGPRLRIVNVPLTTESRQTLRIYDFDGGREAWVFINTPGREIVRRVDLTPQPVCVAPPCHAPHPSYAVLNLHDIPELAGAGRTDIQVRANTRNDVRLWAFVSVTNNQTQHVTTYTPQHRRMTLP